MINNHFDDIMRFNVYKYDIQLNVRQFAVDLQRTGAVNNNPMLNTRKSFSVTLFSLMLLYIVSFGDAMPCLTTGSKKDFDNTRNALKGLESYLSKTVSTLQGQINSINGKVKVLDRDLMAIEGDFKRRQWLKYNDHCYFFGTEKVPWMTAERRCREIGGYLAKVDDANENAWIYQKMMKAKKNTRFWMGMTDPHNGDWRWIYDETKPKYTNWYKGYPNPASSSSSKDSNCVFIYYAAGRWADNSCNYSTSYVCENNFCFS